MLLSTYKVFTGAPLEEAVTILWLLKLPWQWAEVGMVSPWIAQHHGSRAFATPQSFKNGGNPLLGKAGNERELLGLRRSRSRLARRHQSALLQLRKSGFVKNPRSRANFGRKKNVPAKFSRERFFCET